jgi:DNA-binding transcriptional LysR family regulator
MVRKIDWESQIGRRLRLRDLHVFGVVVQRGSMARAAAQLGISQPAVSEVIAGLEHTLGVRLLDRSSHGVESTVYGRALLKRSLTVFDELKQSIRDIEFLADPTTGEVRIGCAESLASALLSPVIRGFAQQYPRVVLRVNHIVTPTLELPELRERNLDIVLARMGRPLADEGDDLSVETLFHDDLVIAAGMHTPWARRRKIELPELVNEPWILTPPNSWNEAVLRDAFSAHGLGMPPIHLTTFSVHLRTNLLATGPFITSFPGSLLRSPALRSILKVLPVDLPNRPWPVTIVKLKNRTLSPVVELFIDHLRAFAREMGEAAPADILPEASARGRAMSAE